MAMNAHWSTKSADEFLFRVAADFVRQIETFMDREGVSQSQLAAKLGVSDGRVSQVLNNPGNLTLKKVVEYAMALNQKVALVAYQTSDSVADAPVMPEVFSRCWDKAGRPRDFFDLDAPSEETAANSPLANYWMSVDLDQQATNAR
jgi:transcriptional regulator with XRE-family HTH domain